jgi:hypothetical protein
MVTRHVERLSVRANRATERLGGSDPGGGADARVTCGWLNRYRLGENLSGRG